jgi:hypothetical protein
MKTKKCSKCKIDKNFNQFNKGTCKDGLSSWCKECIKKYHQKYYLNNAIRIKNQSLKYNQDHKIERQKYHKDYQLKKKYQITLIEYNQKLKQQHKKCAICGRINKTKFESLVVDHCHKTKKFRGLLCQYCNSGIGYFFDNINLLKKAYNYLLKLK